MRVRMKPGPNTITVELTSVCCLRTAIVGDIPPNAGVCKEEKARLEQDAIKQIKEMVGENTLAGEHLAGASEPPILPVQTQIATAV